jgi:hypothetical protein
MADNLTVVGKIVKALPTYITPNGYEVQQIIIKQSMNKYPNLIAVYVYGDLIDKFGEGADVMAYISIEAKLSKNHESYINAIKAWKMIPF